MSLDSYQIHTFGCKVNTYDTGLLQKRLHAAGFLADPEKPSLHILNTCAVTGEATKEALRKVRKLKVENPLATVVLTGCAAQVDGKMIDEVPGVDLVIANSHKGELEEILKKYFRGEIQQKIFRSNIFRNETLGEGGGEEAGHTRSFLKIQDGCNSFCTFCIIPFARGKSRSLPVTLLIQKINQMVLDGVKEVVLTGVHIGDYCDEETYGHPIRLHELVELVLQKTQISRIRLTSLEPIELTDKLLDLYQNPRMCDHFHMSIQSTSNPILKGMKRNYSSNQVRNSFYRIREKIPSAFIGMDLIVGFPGETEELFNETYENLKKWPWTQVHVFPFSEREGTRAPLLEGEVPYHVRKERAKIIRNLSRERFDMEALKQVGRTKSVLVLNGKKEQMTRAVSRDYWDVMIRETELTPVGEEKLVKISGYERAQNNRHKGYLVGVPIDR